MPAHCPKCGAILAERTPVCPRCGKKLPGDNLSWREISALIAETIRIVLMPLGIALLVGGSCLLLFLLF